MQHTPTAVGATQRRKTGQQFTPPENSQNVTVMPTQMTPGTAVNAPQPGTVVIGGQQQQYSNQYPAPASGQPQASSSRALIFVILAFVALLGIGATAYFLLKPAPADPTVNNDTPKPPVTDEKIPGITNPPVVAPDVTAELAQAKSLYQAGNFEEAIGQCDLILKKDPNNAQAFYISGAAKQKLRRTQEAFLAYQRAVELDPKMHAAWQQLGFILMERMDYKGAEDSFKRAIELDPKSPGSWDGLAQTYLIAQQQDKAEEAFKKLLEIEPNNYVALYNVGQLQLFRRDMQAAKDSFMKVIAINPNYAEAHNNLGTIYLSEQLYDQAIIENEKALAIKPSLPSAYYSLSVAYEHKRDFKRATANLEKYLELTGDNDPELQKKLQEYRRG